MRLFHPHLFQYIALLGWAVAVIIGMSVVYGLWGVANNHPLSPEVNALYAGMHRVAWAVAVAWVIFACLTGHGGKTWCSYIQCCDIVIFIPNAPRSWPVGERYWVFFLSGQSRSYVPLKSVQCCVQYHVVLDYVPMTPDCILLSLASRVGWRNRPCPFVYHTKIFRFLHIFGQIAHANDHKLDGYIHYETL